MSILTFPSFVVLRAQFPSPSFLCGRLFPKHDDAIIFEAASYSSRCNGAKCMLI